jgi:uncharacterized protein YifN (PemK superfamily)
MKKGTLWWFILFLLCVIGFLLWKGNFLSLGNLGSWQFFSSGNKSQPSQDKKENIIATTTATKKDTTNEQLDGVDGSVESTTDNSRSTFTDSRLSFSYPKILNGNAVSPVASSGGTIVLYQAKQNGKIVGVLTLSTNSLPSQLTDTTAFHLKDTANKNVRLYFDTVKKSWVSVSNIVTKTGEKILSWSEAMSYFLKASTAPELQNIGLVSFSGRNAYAYYQPTEANIFGYRVFDQKQTNFADIGFVTALAGGLSALPKTTLNEVGYLASEVARTLSLK